MTNINKEGYRPSFQKSYIQLESIAEKAEAARIANGTVKEHQPKRVTDDAVERMAKSDKAHLRVTDYDRIRELYEQGMTDGKIAREMGLVDQSLVRKWRDRYGIPAHGNQKRAPKFDKDLALQMYQDGSSDRQIAEAMGVDRSQVYQWRKKEGLQAVSKMNDKLKQEIYEYNEPDQMAPVVDAYQSTHSLPQDDLEPDMDDTVPNILFSDNFDRDDPIVPSEEHQREEQLIEELLDTATVELNLANFISAIKKSFETSRCEIEEKNAIIQDLLVKNAELAGFIDGIKFVKGWFET